MNKSLVGALSLASVWALQLPLDSLPLSLSHTHAHTHTQHTHALTHSLTLSLTLSLTHRLATETDQEGHCAKPKLCEWLHCPWAEFSEPASTALTSAELSSGRCPWAPDQGLTTPGRTPTSLLPQREKERTLALPGAGQGEPRGHLPFSTWPPGS